MNDRTNNYEITKRRVQSEFSRMDVSAIAERFSLPIFDGVFFTDFVDRNYCIHADTGRITFRDSQTGTYDQEAGFNEVLTLLDLLCDSRPDAHPSGEYTLIQNLATMYNARSYAGEGAYDRFAASLRGKTELLSRILRSMGGIPFGKADVSFRLPVFRDLGIVVEFWDADEDFPASFNLLPDKNTLQYMRYETVWYLCGHVVSRICDRLNESV